MNERMPITSASAGLAAGGPVFQAEGLTSGDLARVQQTEPFLFLLNGWNEIAEASSRQASEALRELEREFPGAGIIVATRTHHLVPPLPGALRLRLLPVGRDDRASGQHACGRRRQSRASFGRGSEEPLIPVLESMDAEDFEDVSRNNTERMPPALRPRAVAAMRPPPKGLSRRLLEYSAAYRVQVKAFGGLKPDGPTKVARPGRPGRERPNRHQPHAGPGPSRPARASSANGTACPIR